MTQLQMLMARVEMTRQFLTRVQLPTPQVTRVYGTSMSRVAVTRLLPTGFEGEYCQNIQKYNQHKFVQKAKNEQQKHENGDVWRDQVCHSFKLRYLLKWNCDFGTKSVF